LSGLSGLSLLAGWFGGCRWGWRGRCWQSRARSPVRLWQGAEHPLFRSLDLPGLFVASVALGQPKVSRCATPTGRWRRWRHDKVCGPVGRALACDTSGCPHRATLRGRSQHGIEHLAGTLVGGLGVQPGGDNGLPALGPWRRVRQTQRVGVIEPRRGEERGRLFGTTHWGEKGA